MNIYKNSTEKCVISKPYALRTVTSVYEIVVVETGDWSPGLVVGLGTATFDLMGASTLAR